MSGWKIEYYDGGWVEKTPKAFKNIIEELSGHEEASFTIANTSANRTWVLTDWIIKISYDGTQRFLGVLYGVEPTLKDLTCLVYNGIYEKLKRRVITANYTGISAATCAEAVRVAGGIAALGSCPSTAITVSWEQTYCFDAIEDIAKQCAKDYWVGTDGTTLYIGTRGSSQSLDNSQVKVSSRNVDRAKKRDKVHARGIDVSGNEVMGVAGTGDNVDVIRPANVIGLTALNALAARELTEVNTDDSHAVLEAPITLAEALYPGDTLTANIAEFFLSGSYQIKKITKGAKTATIEIGRKKKNTQDILSELSKNRDQSLEFNITGGGSVVDEDLKLKPALISGATVKTPNNLSTAYLKEFCILANGVSLAGPTGNMNSYEGGYIALALIEKNGSGERALAKAILDLFASIQNADGSWYQQYNPYKNASGVYERVVTIGDGISGDLKVDSGAALLLWAMSRYDQVTSGTVYKAVVQKALGFLRDLQYAHSVAHGTGLIANLILSGTIDTYAFAADSAECLLAMKAALDAYGDPLLTTGGYDVKTMANDIYYSLCVSSWIGSGTDYYHTSYPTDGGVLIPFTFKEKISYTQALCAWANKAWAGSGYLTVADYSAQCELCLDFILPLTAGQWGGQMYAPYYGAADETQDEFSGYTALMLIACSAVNASKYADEITKMTNFLKWMALNDGRLYNNVDSDGRLWRAKIDATTESYGFLSLPLAQALYAGA